MGPIPNVIYKEIPDCPGYKVGSDGSVWSNRSRWESGEKQRSLAKEFGVTHEAIHSVVRGRSWDWLKSVDSARSKRHGNAVLTVEQVLDIRRRVASGEHGSQTRLAKEFGVPRTTIKAIVHRHNWTWLN